MPSVSQRAAPMLIMGVLLAIYIVLAVQAFRTGYWINSVKIMLAGAMLGFLAFRALYHLQLEIALF